MGSRLEHLSIWISIMAELLLFYLYNCKNSYIDFILAFAKKTLT